MNHIYLGQMCLKDGNALIIDPCFASKYKGIQVNVLPGWYNCYARLIDYLGTRVSILYAIHEYFSGMKTPFLHKSIHEILSINGCNVWSNPLTTVDVESAQCGIFDLWAYEELWYKNLYGWNANKDLSDKVFNITSKENYAGILNDTLNGPTSVVSETGLGDGSYKVLVWKTEKTGFNVGLGINYDLESNSELFRGVL